MMATWLQGGTVVDEAGRRAADVLFDSANAQVIACGTSAEIAALIESEDAVDRVDVEGCFVTPGFVDLCSHLSEPGNEGAETVQSASRAAALGGYSAIVAMPDTTPCADTASAIDTVLALSSNALCAVVPAGSVSEGLQGSVLAPMAEMAGRGVSLFSDCGSGIQDINFLRTALEYVADLQAEHGTGCRIMQPCDMTALSVGSHMNEGQLSSTLGLAGAPREAEALMVTQAIAMAKLSKTAIHLQGLSVAESFDLVRRAKNDGVAVTADIAPHHLALTEAACIDFDPAFKVWPPLRTTMDLAAADQALQDGTIDAVATNHSAHTPDAKERPFDLAPAGALGLETALAVLLSDTSLSIETVVGVLSRKPASIAGLTHLVPRRIEPGATASLVVIDPKKTWVCEPSTLASRASNTPFAGKTFTGKIRHTFLNGEFVVANFEATR